mgnify:CR=1 FL=1
MGKLQIMDTGSKSQPAETLHGGYAAAPYSLIEVHGQDAERFLNSQTTSDVKALKTFQSQKSALLDRKAKVVAYFTLYRKNKSYRIVCQSTQTQTILENLDKYVFSDKVEFLDLSAGRMLAVIGADARVLINENLTAEKNLALFDRDLIDGELANIDVHIFKAHLSCSEAFLIYCGADRFDELQAKLKPSLERYKLKRMSEDDLKVERIEAGVAQFGQDFDGANLIIELGMEDSAISYTKGCFQGQEVLARVKSHGSPNKQLAGLILEPSGQVACGTPLMVAGHEAAQVLSNGYSTKLGKQIALALVKRDFRTPGRILEASAGSWSGTATVQLLPFIQNLDPKAKARELYQGALQLYTTSGAEQAIADLRTALLLDSSMEDAYEALGVILSKEGQIDEAVQLMEALARINPDSIMAYANLSVFYLEQGGGKEKAEEAKAQSMSIRMRLAAKEAMQQHKEKEDSAKIEAEARERQAMFEQVIEIDADDLFANNGLGNCYNILKEYALAEKYLLKALAIKPAHTVAYQELGTTYEGLGQLDKAVAIYKAGIDVAAQKGDMTPLKAMQNRLNALTENSKKQ